MAAPNSRMRTLVPQSYSPSVTNIDEAFRAPRVKQKPGELTKRVKVNPVAFTLVANTPFQSLNENPRRRGLIIQNFDGSATLFYSFGVVVDFNSGLRLSPGSIALFDFVTPTDAVWVMSTANIQGATAEMSEVYSNG